MTNIFDINLIKLNVFVPDKEKLFDMMVQDFYQYGIISKKENYLLAIKSREKALSTGIGYGVAIPHSQHDDVKKLGVVVYLLANELDYEALDEQPVKVVIMLAVPTFANTEYMKTLGFISKALHDEADRQRLMNCHNQQEIFEFFNNIWAL